MFNLLEIIGNINCKSVNKKIGNINGHRIYFQKVTKFKFLFDFIEKIGQLAKFSFRRLISGSQPA